jgi:hypothetical protein
MSSDQNATEQIGTPITNDQLIVARNVSPISVKEVSPMIFVDNSGTKWYPLYRVSVRQVKTI